MVNELVMDLGVMEEQLGISLMHAIVHNLVTVVLLVETLGTFHNRVRLKFRAGTLDGGKER
jgi:hypothetical protein